jgi:hypothetical protein
MNTRIITTALAASILAIPAIADAPGYFKVPGTETTMKVYGQVELRNSYGLTGFNDVTAPAGNTVSGGDYYDQSVLRKGIWKTSYRGRFGFTSTTPSSFGDINVKVELQGDSGSTDTASYDGSGVYVRHAYGEIGGFLLGQTDSLMGWGHYEPNSLWGFIPDENGNWGKARQARYTFAPTKEFKVAFSIEQENAGNESTGGNKGPVIVAGANYSGDWGGVAATVSYQKVSNWTRTSTPYVTTTESKSGISYAVSGAWNITANDTLQAWYSKAGGEFGSGNDGFMDDWDGDLAFYKTTAINLSYAHTWNDAFSSNVGIGQVTWPKDEVDNDLYGERLTVRSFFVNTYWQAAKNVKFGAEYQFNEGKNSYDNWYRDKDENGKNKTKDHEIRAIAVFTFF